MTSKGMTLVELVTSVAVVTVLASIAVPKVHGFCVKSREAEVPTNVDGIKTVEMAYHASHDGWVFETSFRPDDNPGKEQRPWVAGNFATLGWKPDGDVWGSYKVDPEAENFHATGVADPDQDGSYYICEANEADFECPGVSSSMDGESEESCSIETCGRPPAAPACLECPDGSTVCYTCVLSGPVGTCGWQIDECAA